MEDKVINNIGGLPSWMQFTILILFTIMIVVPTIWKIISEKKITDKLVNNERKLGILLDLLYSKFANNLSVDVAKEIIALSYIRGKFIIRDKIIDLLKVHNYTIEGKFDKYKFKEDLNDFVRNKYYEDSMFLGKMTCKNIKLNFVHIEKIKSDYIVDNISSFLENSNFKLTCSLHDSTCNNLDIYLSTFYQSIINKTLIELESITSKINTDYGN